MKISIKNFIKLITINIFGLTLIFIILEIVASFLFPEFKNNYFTPYITKGKIMNFSTINNFGEIRTANENQHFNFDRPLFIIIGDSISEGFGLDYSETYFSKLEKVYNLNNKERIDFITFGKGGFNLEDSYKRLDSFINIQKGNIKYVLYQFNFNDISPYSKDDLLNQVSPLSKKLSSFRYGVLNRSVLVNKVFHIGGLVKRNKVFDKDCEQRGINSLGEYTWAYAGKGFEKDSSIAWEKFEKKLIELKNLSEKNKFKLIIFISPLLKDIDTNKLHKYFNNKSLDFGCATINPREKLYKFSKENNIILYDPTFYIKSLFEKKAKDGNYKDYYFTADDNHFNEIMSQDLSNFLYSKIFGNFE